METSPNHFINLKDHDVVSNQFSDSGRSTLLTPFPSWLQWLCMQFNIWTSFSFWESRVWLNFRSGNDDLLSSIQSAISKVQGKGFWVYPFKLITVVLEVMGWDGEVTLQKIHNYRRKIKSQFSFQITWRSCCLCVLSYASAPAYNMFCFMEKYFLK